jgi:hypothetical protein
MTIEIRTAPPASGDPAYASATVWARADATSANWECTASSSTHCASIALALTLASASISSLLNSSAAAGSFRTAASIAFASSLPRTRHAMSVTAPDGRAGLVAQDLGGDGRREAEQERNQQHL